MVCVRRTRHNVERFKGLEGRFLRTNQALPKRQVFRPAVSLTIDGLSTKTSGGQRFKDRRGFHELNRSSQERGFFFHRSGCIRARWNFNYVGRDTPVCESKFATLKIGHDLQDHAARLTGDLNMKLERDLVRINSHSTHPFAPFFSTCTLFCRQLLHVDDCMKSSCKFLRSWNIYFERPQVRSSFESEHYYAK